MLGEAKALRGSSRSWRGGGWEAGWGSSSAEAGQAEGLMKVTPVWPTGTERIAEGSSQKQSGRD